MRPATRVVAFDSPAEDPWRATSPPLYQTATFAQDSAEEFGRYDYARSGNPTRETLEAHCAALEGGGRVFAYASGIAAIAAVARLARPGEEIVAHDDLYGGTHRLLAEVLAHRGIGIRFADLVDGSAADWRRALSPQTRFVLVESITNPLLRVPDLPALAAIAHECGARLAVDATALSPWLQRPLDLGADLVVHSATKLLNGHGDVTAGIVATRDADLAARLAFEQNAEGTALGPFDAWLLLRGIRTLALRVDRQQQTARRVAARLARRPDLLVHYPGLPSHPDRDRLRRLARGPGVVVSFQTGDVARSVRIVESLHRFAIAVSFGGVASSASLPCRMSHASIPAERRTLPDDLVRLSIGIEDADDLIEDLEAALAAAPTRRSPLAAVAAQVPEEVG